MSSKEKSKVLIVDDQVINIMALANILKPEYEVIIAADGMTAIEAAEKHIPGIVLLDIMMPEVDGFEVLIHLKESETTKNIPVIFITGLDATEDEEKGFMLGAVDYITKPFHSTIVKARVKTHLKMAEYISAIERLSMVDTLTELPNRRSFDNRMETEWGRAIREKTPIGILMIDVDKFKVYNDVYGHPQGDVLLKTLSDVFRNTLKRETDFVARWGGEEFAVLLPNTGLDGSVMLAEQIRENVEQLKILCSDESKTSITISIGVNSLIPSKNDSVDKFISDVDQALYTAKNNGRNQVWSHQGERP